MKFRDLKYGQGFTFKGDNNSTYYVKQWRELYLDPSYRYSRPQRADPNAEVTPR